MGWLQCFQSVAQGVYRFGKMRDSVPLTGHNVTQFLLRLFKMRHVDFQLINTVKQLMFCCHGWHQLFIWIFRFRYQGVRFLSLCLAG